MGLMRQGVREGRKQTRSTDLQKILKNSWDKMNPSTMKENTAATAFFGTGRICEKKNEIPFLYG